MVQSINTLLDSKAVQDDMKIGRLKIQPANYTDSQGKSRTMYELDREAFSLVTFGFTGERALRFKLDYIAAFNAMKEKLKTPPAAPTSELEILDTRDLVVMGEGGKPTTDSKRVAAKFEKVHFNVMQGIRSLECSKVFHGLNFQFVEIIEKNAIGGKVDKSYYTMTRDGFSFLCLGFTGKKSAKFKEDYIAAFNAMEEKLKAQVKPTSQLEVLVGVANGLLEQDKKLKELEGKVVKADEKNRAIEEKVSEIDHVLYTSGCEPRWMQMADARGYFAPMVLGLHGATRGRIYTVTPIYPP